MQRKSDGNRRRWQYWHKVREPQSEYEFNPSDACNSPNSHHHVKRVNGLGRGERFVLFAVGSILVRCFLEIEQVSSPTQLRPIKVTTTNKNIIKNTSEHTNGDTNDKNDKGNISGNINYNPHTSAHSFDIQHNKKEGDNSNNEHTIIDNAKYTKSSFIKIGNPYTKASLSNNPHLGWQPPLRVLESYFSWRQCFNANPENDGSSQPNGCRENPYDLGEAPIPIPNYVTDAGEKIWVPDVTMVRTMMLYGKDRDGNEFPPPLDDELCEDIGVMGEKSEDPNKHCLTESMIRPTGDLNSIIDTLMIFPSNHYGEGADENGSNEDDRYAVVPAPKLLCLVYTMADAHATRIRAMRDTWAGGCDGFLAFSTKSDPRLPAISLEHEGPESYNNMWQKVRSIWKFVGMHYIDQFDWFYLGGDDLFVMPHNLKTYLASLVYKDGGADPRTKEYFVGRRFHDKGRKGPNGENRNFNSGAPGYTLSRAALIKFLANINDDVQCSAHKRTSEEDLMISRCLGHLGIHAIDSRDANGRERFHPFDPGSHYYFSGKARKKWYKKKSKEWGIIKGKKCCAPDSVSFHYFKQASLTRHVQALLYFCGGDK